MSRNIVTRFAPSPTGYLHIGGARTALFNWLYARGAMAQGQGKFLLRIEDTDRARHNKDAVSAILDGLTWLGLDWDGEPISQFERSARHADVARQLLQQGKAYRCWLQGEELEAARTTARNNKIRFTSPWRDHTGAVPDTPYAIRLKAPKSGETRIVDQVQGNVTFPADALDDMVLLRSDDTPTYMLAVVVDDYDMGVSHIIRGDDHLVNAARQQQLYQALDWEVPVFAHIPLIHGQDGAKLSKRHGALGVEAYRDMGYLSEGLASYLLRLGWSHGDEEIIPLAKALEWFDIKDINKAASRLDLDKLNFINASFIHNMSGEAFIEQALPFLEQADTITSEHYQRLLRATDFIKSRAKTLADISSLAAFLLLEWPYEITGKAAKPLRKDGALEYIAKIVTLIKEQNDWSSPSIEDRLQQFATDHGVGFGQIGPPTRAALTAGHPSPGLGQTIYALGKDETIARLTAVLDEKF
ncbi:MAG: glutamate--tRNA ligase [bacterium]